LNQDGWGAGEETGIVFKERTPLGNHAIRENPNTVWGQIYHGYKRPENRRGTPVTL